MNNEQKEIMITNEQDLYVLYEKFDNVVFSPPFKRVKLIKHIKSTHETESNLPIRIGFLQDKSGVLVRVDAWCFNTLTQEYIDIKKEPKTFTYPFRFLDFNLACYDMANKIPAGIKP